MRFYKPIRRRLLSRAGARSLTECFLSHTITLLRCVVLGGARELGFGRLVSLMPLARCVRAVGFPRTAPSPPKPHHNMLRFIACSVLVCAFV